MRRTAPFLLVTALVLAACGSDDPSTDDASPDAVASDDADAPAATASNSTPADEPVADSTPADEPVAATGGGNGTAMLTLANGESFEFGILCSLEPQMAAGSEILFTATSYDSPGLDITQFGDEGTIQNIASVSVFDADYNTLWAAESLFEAVGGRLELSLDGSTIRGSGSFFPDGDMANEPVDGEVEARC